MVRGLGSRRRYVPSVLSQRVHVAVILLEAQKRIGGRVRTEDLNGVPIDMGAMIIVGTQGNPLTTLAEQLGCRLHRLDRSRCPLYDGAALLPADVDGRAEKRFNELMEKTSKLRDIRCAAPLCV